MKKKSGMFKLEPDKFSIHTFEISKKMTNQNYKKMRDRLYCQCPKGGVYRDRDWQGEGERHRCRWFQQNGLRISLEKDVHGQISTCYLRIAVNPRKLIGPNSSYLGILPPTEESVQDVSKMFFGPSPLPPVPVRRSALRCAAKTSRTHRRLYPTERTTPQTDRSWPSCPSNQTLHRPDTNNTAPNKVQTEL